MVRPEETCSPCLIARALERVGDAWSMLILRDAGAGTTRFDDFRRSLGIAPNILTARLRALVAAGLLERRRYQERPPRDEYVLTAAGRDFLPVLHVLAAWAGRHYGGGEMTQTLDAETGKPIDAVVIDRNTGAPIGTRPLRLETP